MTFDISEIREPRREVAIKLITQLTRNFKVLTVIASYDDTSWLSASKVIARPNSGKHKSAVTDNLQCDTEKTRQRMALYGLALPARVFSGAEKKPTALAKSC